MKLMLTSSGIGNDTLRRRFIALLPRAPQECHAIFVPTAADPEPDKGFVRMAREEIESLVGAVEEVDLKALSADEFGERLHHADVLYINGGNTFYLLHWARQVELGRHLPEFFERGGVYVGVSAGTIVTSPTIELAAWKGVDDPEVISLSDLSALNLIKRHFFVHYQKEHEGVIAEYETTLSAPLLRLNDGEALIVSENNALHLVPT